MTTHTRARIVVVEDDERARELIGATLRRAGHDVHEVADGESALAAVGDPRPDLVVLDVGLPGMSGWDVCREIRTRSEVPILFVTAFNRDEDVVRGLDIGADGYLPKPFSPAVLLAQVESLLRRAPAGSSDRVVDLGELTIDPAAGEVRFGGAPIHLTPTEHRILAHLARHAGEVVSPRALAQAAGQGYNLSDTEAAAVVKVHVRRIRRKIEPNPDAPEYLVSVRGLGYSLVAPPGSASAQPSSSARR